jgi:hypothetical protein
MKEEFEDTKGVIRIRISKNRQHNGQKKKYSADREYNIIDILIIYFHPIPSITFKEKNI